MIALKETLIKGIMSLQGGLVSEPKTFPSDIKAFADFIHGMGLKLGIYLDAGLVIGSNGT